MSIELKIADIIREVYGDTGYEDEGRSTEAAHEIATLLGADIDDCYHSAMPGEPRFTLLARDPDFARLVNKWAVRRAADINCGLRPECDRDKVVEALRLATEGAYWRKSNEEQEWRK